MASNRIKVYWLLLLVLLYTTTLILSVGETQARYETTVVQNTVVQSQPKGITSNCLVSKNEVPLTVLVGELSMYRSTAVSFWLKSTGENATGKLAWSVVDPDHAQYLKITMASGMDSIDSNMEVDLLKDAKMEITMTILPTEMARNTEHAAMKINVLVTWGEEMWGTFQVVLPEVKKEVSEGDAGTVNETENNEDPEQIIDENTSTDPTEQTQNTDSDGVNTDTETAASNQVETELTEITQQATIEAALSVSETGENLEETEPATDTERTATDPTETTDETEPSDPTVAVTEPSEAATEPTVEATEETTVPTEDATEPTGETTESTEPAVDPTEEETQPEEDPIRMETLRSFDPSEKLPVRIALTEEITAIRIGLLVMDLEETKNPDEPVLDFDVLPDYTRFSVNGGESYYMMYDGFIAEFALQGMTELTVLLDFSHAGLKEDEDLVLAMEAYAGETLVETCRSTVSPGAQESLRTTVHSLQQPMTVEDTAVPAVTEASAVAILSRNNVLEYTLPLDWADKDLEYSVQILTRAADGSLVYNHVPLSDSSLSATYTNYSGTHNLVFQLGETLPQAGTYRLNMKWSYEGICFAEQQTTFFINYSAYSAYTLGGQEVP